MKQIPDNIVAFFGFPRLLDSVLERLENQNCEYPTEPWIVLSRQKDADLKRVVAGVEGDGDYALYVSMLQALLKFTTKTWPEKIELVDSYQAQKDGIYKRYQKETPAYQKYSAAISKLHEEVPNIEWLKGSRNDSQEFDYRLVEDGYSSGLVIQTLCWILMKAEVFTGETFIDYSSGSCCNGILSLDSFDGWEPLFSTYKISNTDFCNGSNYGRTLLPEDEQDSRQIVDERIHDDDPTNFECFLSQGSLIDWVLKFKNWDYPAEVAREFFGLHGFFSHLYNKVHIDLDEERFPVWVEQIVLPEFDMYFS